MEHVEKFLISVAPLARIPLTRDQSFFYTSQESIEPGTLVRIPIGRRTTNGIVTRCHADFARASGITLKPIAEVLMPHELTPEQLALAEFISAHYYTPLGIVLKLFILERKTSRDKATQTALTSIKPITLSPSSQKICTEVLAQKAATLHTTFSAESYHALVFLVHTQLQKTLSADTGAQVLILVPERCHVPMLEMFLQAYFPEEIMATYASTYTGGAQSEAWEKIRSGGARIIIGSRSAICAPFADLSLIITWSAHAASYKQWEKHPRYDARICANTLAEISNASHIAITPQITTLSSCPSYTLSAPRIPQTHLVDMKIEYNEINEKRFKKARPALSRILITQIKNALSQKQQILLFVGRSGKNAFNVCEKCRTVARCPQCERALTESTRGYHRCHHCPFKTDTFSSMHKL